MKAKTVSKEETRVQDEFKLLRRDEIHPDPDQPRKTFSESSLDELALSIMEQGLIQPIIVRLVKAKYRIIEPELHNPNWVIEEADYSHEQPWVRAAGFPTDGECKKWMDEHGGLAALTDRFVIIAGERRWRACAPREIDMSDNQEVGGTPVPEVKWKGLDEIPCLIRDVDEHRKFAQQWIENAQRENVSQLDEANALSAELAKRKAADPKFKAENLATELGMSRAGLYGRMALTRLHAPVREALLRGSVSTSVASLVAMLPREDQQEKLLKLITNEDDWEYPYSVRDVQAVIDTDYVKPLKGAPFDLDSATLYEDLPACQACPQRTGNMVEQFPDLKIRPNVCTNPTCFAAKCKLHWMAEAKNKANAGKTVLTEQEFRKAKRDLVAGDRFEYAVNRSGTFESLMGMQKPEPVLVATAEGLQTFYKKEEAYAAAKKNGVKFQVAATEADRKKEEEKEKETRARKERVEACVEELWAKICEKLEGLKEEAAWKFLAKVMDDNYGEQVSKEELAPAKSAKARVIAGVLKVNSYRYCMNWHGEWHEDKLEMWDLLGIDVKAEFAKREAAAQTALPLAKKTPESGKLLDVKKVDVKAIKRAQKARWAAVTAKAKK